MSNLNLSHEYNEYVVGYVVTDKDSGRMLSFQLEKIESNHPSPNYYLYHSCAGDESHCDWSESELSEANDYVNAQADIQ